MSQCGGGRVGAMSSWLAAASAAGEGSIGGADCETSCGGVDIPFPFGMGPDHCWLLGFEMSCKDTGNAVLKPFLAKDAIVEVLNISLEQGEVKVLQPSYLLLLLRRCVCGEGGLG